MDVLCLQYTAPVYALCKGVALAGMSGGRLAALPTSSSSSNTSSKSLTLGAELAALGCLVSCHCSMIAIKS
jgi:hypothetical protein